MQTDVTLKPCPFCGGGDFVVEPEPWSWVHCDGCDANGPVTETEAQAIAAWNRRADAQGEPVGWLYERRGVQHVTSFRWANAYPDDPWTETPLYTHPPAQGVAALVEAVRHAIFVFDTYAENHTAKGTAEGHMKAERNRQEASNLRTALAKHERNGHD